jgi:acetyl esterase/lipase
LPAGYEDSFRGLKWAVSGEGDPWLSQHGDLGRLFLAGDSAGGNIVHNVLMMAAYEGEAEAAAQQARIEGVVLLHAGFGGREPVDEETPEAMEIAGKMWGFVCPEATDGVDDPRLNPLAAAAPSLRNLPCKRVLVCVAEKDFTRPRGRAYHEALAASGWSGTAELFESEGQEHVFFLVKPGCDEAAALMDRLVSFFAGN